MVDQDSQATPPQPELSIVIPAYNEAERLPRFLASVLSYVEASGRDIEVLVVDDGSTDGTAGVALAHREGAPALRVLRSARNAGKGAAVRAGMMHARAARRLFVDADGATAIDELPELERALAAGADLAIGTREGGERQVVASLMRRFLGRAFNRAVRSRAIVGLRDTQCGFKLFQGEALRLFPLLQEDGFAFDVELLFLAQRRGLRIAELPVDWTAVPGSKVHLLRDGVRMLRAVRRIEGRFQRGEYEGIAPRPTPCIEL